MPGLGQAMRDAVRFKVALPVAGHTILMRPLSGYTMLVAGLRPLHIKAEGPAPGTEEAEDRAKQVLREAKRMAVACSIEPRIVRKETTNPEELWVEDLCDEDLLLIYRRLIRLTERRYYGTNEQAFDPFEEPELWHGQADMAALLDAIGQRYHINPLDLLRATPEELSFLSSFITAGKDAQDKANEEAAAAAGGE